MKTINAEFFKPLYEYLLKHGELEDIITDNHHLLIKKFNAGCHPNIDKDFALNIIGTSGQIQQIEEVVDGKRHGLFISFYTNGRLKVITNYKNGELHGYYCRFDQFKESDIDDSSWLLSRSTWENGERTEHQNNTIGWIKDLDDVVYACILDNNAANKNTLGFIYEDGSLALDTPDEMSERKKSDDELEKKYIADVTIDTETTIQELSNVYYIQKRISDSSNATKLDYGALVEQTYGKTKQFFTNHGAYYHSTDKDVYGTWNNGKRCGVWAYFNNDAECTLHKLHLYDKEGNLACEIKNIETGGRVYKSKIIRVIDHTDGTKFSKERFTITRAYVLSLTGSTESWLFGDDPKDYIPGTDKESSKDVESKLTNLITKPDCSHIDYDVNKKEFIIPKENKQDNNSDDDMLLIL